MCFTVPLKVINKKGNRWVMEDGRKVKQVLTGKIEKGDYLICQQDMAVDKINKSKALAMRKAIKGVSDELSKRN